LIQIARVGTARVRRKVALNGKRGNKSLAVGDKRSKIHKKLGFLGLIEVFLIDASEYTCLSALRIERIVNTMIKDAPVAQARAFIEYLRMHTKDFTPPLSNAMVDCFGKNPFIILASCLVSLRARDRVTTPLCLKFFENVQTPEQLLAVPLQDLEQTFFSVGFYRAKAAALRAVSHALIEKHEGKVPSDEASLMALPGVGLKTASLVLAMAFDIPAICVDVHVHKISNFLGWVTTKTPEQTEAALRAFLPKDLWIDWNTLLVTIGQNGCFSSRGCGGTCRVFELGCVRPS